MESYLRQSIPSYKYTLANVNLRENKSTSAHSLAVIPANTKVQAIDADEYWYEIQYNGQKGYVYVTYLSKTQYVWRDTSLRSYPSAESNPVTTIPSRTSVQVLSVAGSWSYVIYNNASGYIFNYFLTDDGNPPEAYDFTYFYTDMPRFVNENNVQSPTVNLITTDLTNKLTYIFKKGATGTWNLLYVWECTVGAPSTPTIRGTFYVAGRKPYFGTNNYRVKYATRIKGGYYYHSILYNAQGTEVIDARLGLALSHGCICLATDHALWIYSNVLDSSAIVIN